MRSMLLIARRELGVLFGSPIAYIVAAAFLAISGYIFSLLLLTTAQARLDGMFLNIPFTLLFIAPLLGMRLLAEEQKQGTLEVLLTAPLRDGEVIVGKFLAVLACFAAMLATTGSFVAFLYWLDGQPDVGVLVSSYLGLLLLGSAMLAVSTLTSACTANQIVAAIVSFAALIMLYAFDRTDVIVAPALRPLAQYLSLRLHYVDFARGAIDLGSVVYYLTLTIGCLLLATRALQLRRYR